MSCASLLQVVLTMAPDVRTTVPCATWWRYSVGAHVKQSLINPDTYPDADPDWINHLNRKKKKNLQAMMLMIKCKY